MSDIFTVQSEAQPLPPPYEGPPPGDSSALGGGSQRSGGRHWVGAGVGVVVGLDEPGAVVSEAGAALSEVGAEAALVALAASLLMAALLAPELLAPELLAPELLAPELLAPELLAAGPARSSFGLQMPRARSQCQPAEHDAMQSPVTTRFAALTATAVAAKMPAPAGVGTPPTLQPWTSSSAQPTHSAALHPNTIATPLRYMASFG